MNNWTGYKYLRERNLLDKFKEIVDWDNARVYWTNLNDEEVVYKYTQFYTERQENESLSQVSLSGYKQIKKRNLVEVLHKKIGYEKKAEKPWKEMSDEELLNYMTDVYTNNNCTSLTDLEKCDMGEYGTVGSGGVQVLRKRIGTDIFLSKVGSFNQKDRWTKLNDDELVGAALKFIDDSSVNSIEELKLFKGGGDALVTQLRSRNLIQTILENKNWKMRIGRKKMSKDELLKTCIAHAKQKECKNLKQFGEKVGHNPIKYMKELEVFQPFLKELRWPSN